MLAGRTVVRSAKRDLARPAGEGGPLARSGGDDPATHHPRGARRGARQPDPARSGQRNLRAWCQACHLAHDRAWHLLQRWITFSLRYARGDLFLGPYQHGPSAAAMLAEILARISDRLSNKRTPEPPLRCSRGVWTGDQLALG